MITNDQAKKLRSLIKKLAECDVADSWKGSGNPEDTPYIERDLKIAKRELDLFLNEITEKKK